MKKILYLIIIILCSCQAPTRKYIITENDTIASLIKQSDESFIMIVSEKVNLRNEKQILSFAHKFNIKDYAEYSDIINSYIISVPVYIHKHSFNENPFRKEIWEYVYVKDKSNSGQLAPVEYLNGKEGIKVIQLETSTLLNRMIK